jgi:hypothetical protein
LHRLIAADYWHEWLLTIRTILRIIIVDGAAFCAVSAHVFAISESGLRVGKKAKASNDQPKNEVADPDGDPDTEENEAEEFGFLRCVHCPRKVTGRDLSVHLGGENNADYSERETADR